MKQFRKILGFIFSLVFAFTLFLANPVESKASNYTYTVKVILGGSGDEGAYFNNNLGFSVPSTAKVEMTDNNTCIKISNLAYEDEVTIDPTTMVKIKPQTKLDDEGNEVQFSKYYVKGLRMSGMDNVLHKNSFKVEYDETFVVAYGVGEVVPYVVNYVNKAPEAGDSDNTFINPDDGSKYTVDSVTCYAPADEELYVAYRNIPGYTPNAYNYHTKSLKSSAASPFEFTFYYTKGGGQTIVEENTVEVYSSSTVTGAPEYSYEAISRETQHRQGPVRVTGNAGNGGANANDADNGNAEGGNEADQAGDDTTTIEDEETPRDVIDIDDEEVAKSGEAKDRFIRNMIIGIIIAIIAIVSILVALYIAEKKRKKEIVKSQIDKKEE